MEYDMEYAMVLNKSYVARGFAHVHIYQLLLALNQSKQKYFVFIRRINKLKITSEDNAKKYDMEYAMVLNKSYVARGFAHVHIYQTESIDLADGKGKSRSRVFRRSNLDKKLHSYIDSDWLHYVGQKKMHFLLSSMSVVYVLTTPIHEDGGDDATMKQIRKRNKWDNDDYAKYMAEDASSKKFLFTQHKMNMDEAIQVSCIIDKLPSSWKDFKHTLKHKKEELTLVDLGNHLCIKESLK
nr:hypothetical protein [Tanacetum cinerariifolium]